MAREKLSPELQQVRDARSQREYELDQKRSGVSLLLKQIGFNFQGLSVKLEPEAAETVKTILSGENIGLAPDSAITVSPTYIGMFNSFDPGLIGFSLHGEFSPSPTREGFDSLTAPVNRVLAHVIPLGSESRLSSIETFKAIDANGRSGSVSAKSDKMTRLDLSETLARAILAAGNNSVYSLPKDI